MNRHKRKFPESDKLSTIIKVVKLNLVTKGVYIYEQKFFFQVSNYEFCF